MEQFASLQTRRKQHSQKCKSTYKSAKPTPALFFVPGDLDIWPFDPKINEFPGLMVDHFKFDDPSWSGFWDIVRINGQTDRQTQKQMSVKTLHPRLPSAWVTIFWQEKWISRTEMSNTRIQAVPLRCVVLYRGKAKTQLLQIKVNWWLVTSRLPFLLWNWQPVGKIFFSNMQFKSGLTT